MLVKDIANKQIVIWGAGKEGRAVAGLIYSILPEQSFIFVDEGSGLDYVDIANKQYKIVRDSELIERALAVADVIIKSPGVSFYHHLLEREKKRGVCITSLLNLWFAENQGAFVIGVTGTKGKSTTATLLEHTLTEIGKRAVVLGNVGVPVAKCTYRDADFFIIEISSYQAANFTENCDIAVMTSLYPEHLDWHKSLDAYYQDKSNLLLRSRLKIVESAASATLEQHNICIPDVIRFNSLERFHFIGCDVYKGLCLVGTLKNEFLFRKHNRNNVCAVLTVIDALGFDLANALQAMHSYNGLPHRQYELGEKDGVLFVDDSISTTPQSSIAAMDAYIGRPITIIVGGFDRGIDYTPLFEYITREKINAVVCIGSSGKRIFSVLKENGMNNISFVESMDEAVICAKAITPVTGVILLSPASSSFDMFEDYIERAECFAKACGFDLLTV